MGVNLFAQAQQLDSIVVMLSLKVLFHQEFLVIKLVVFRLYSCVLLDQGLEVFVFLGELKDLALELGYEQVFCVARLM